LAGVKCKKIVRSLYARFGKKIEKRKNKRHENWPTQRTKKVVNEARKLCVLCVFHSRAEIGKGFGRPFSLAIGLSPKEVTI